MGPIWGLSVEQIRTDKSDRTDTIDNFEFLECIFGKKHDETCPIVVSFMGDPAKVSSTKWFGYPWMGEKVSNMLGADANNYFSLAKFKPDESGQYRRRKSHFAGLYAIMLDDVGTKVPLDRLTLSPSWLLETSPGNFQAGYLLSEPLSSSKQADQLMNAVVNAGLCDPGANGPTARLARLPVAINGKHTPPFKCQLKNWFPEKRYTVQELIDGLQLEIVEKDRSKRKRAEAKSSQDTQEEHIWIPRPEENAVLAALRNHNLYKSPLGSGRHDISCPWKLEHSGGVDNGTAYFEPDDNWPIGGFKCFHGHCAERHIRDLLRLLDIDIKSARMKPAIHVVKGEIHRIVDAAEFELANSNQYYQRGGLIVSVFSDPSTSETCIQPVSLPALVRALAGVATWEQFDARSKDWVRIDPPARHAAILFDSNSYRHLPFLKGLTRQPYLRPDGSVITVAGYDPATGIFGVFDAKKFSISESPSRVEVESALWILKELLTEFSFASETDRFAALAAILTAAIRPSLTHAPMFHVKAHSVGSGKSYLCELITAFATPQRGTPTTFPADDEECSKLLLAELLRAPAVIEFDNLTSDILPHKSLCTALTSEFMNGRILGVSKTAVVSTRALFLSSGNNIGPIRDMSRRCIIINLNPEVEIPAARTFKRPNLMLEVFKKREYYVSLALTIIRGWIVANKPMTECKSLASYGDWSELCRQPLLWLGYPDPASSVFETISQDPDRELLGRLLITWQKAFGKTPTMIRDALTVKPVHAVERGELMEIFHDIAEERGVINRRKLGWWIKRHAGQIVDGLRFVRCEGNSSAEKWRVESVSKVLSVPPPPNEKTVMVTEAYMQVLSGK